MSYLPDCSRICLLVAGLMYSLAALLPANVAASTRQEWRFTVYLDETPIGYHDFSVEQAQGHGTITTRAHFDVTFLKIPLFEYRHQNTEQWHKQCLKSIASTTDQNGERFQVEGAIIDNEFEVSTSKGNVSLPACISSFAYWDKSFLRHTRLLNSQTGEYLEVDVEELDAQSVLVSNTSVPAERYRLTASELDIELWYSSNDRWLGLQAKTDNGRLLRYVIE